MAEGAPITAALASTVRFVEEDETKRSREARFVEAAQELRHSLSDEDWERLPELVREYRRTQRGRLSDEHLLAHLGRQRLNEQAATRATADRLRAEEALRRRRGSLIGKVLSAFEDDFLNAEVAWRACEDVDLLSETDFIDLRIDFVRGWSEREFKPMGVPPLDREQAAAVAATNGNTQVVARAGAGKTRTLVARAVFLQKHCGVAPNEQLLLAFNRRAADEIRARLTSHLGTDVPHVMTFHALAYALVQPNEQLLMDDAASSTKLLSREFQRVIDEHLRSESSGPKIRALMLSHFRSDWERITGGGFHLQAEEQLEFRRELPRETLRGEHVKSFGEKLIANTLFESDVTYAYEPGFRWDGSTYRPDFLIKISDGSAVVIEYFGLDGDLDYDRMSEEKRRFWSSKPKYTLLEFNPTDIAQRGVDAFRQLLLSRLRDAGVTTRALTDDEIWHRLERRAIDSFTETARTFVSRCRKGGIQPEDLDTRLLQHTPASHAEKLFGELIPSIYRGYLGQLASTGQEDFDGLVWRAVRKLADGNGDFVRNKGREHGNLAALRFILIDEFQDFSPLFNALIQQIRKLNPTVNVLCVGDDWQAINGFAGSDLRFFEAFNSHFVAAGPPLNIRTNYRSAQTIVAAGNTLMTGRGVEAIANKNSPGQLIHASLSTFAPTRAEEARHSGDWATAALARIVNHLFDAGLDVTLLSRVNRAPWRFDDGEPAGARPTLEPLVKHLRSHLPPNTQRTLSASTAHKYKGLESPAVVILDADARKYPLLHSHWIFLRALGDTLKKIEAEERRLFYVALTRAEDTLVILSDGHKPESPYLQELRARAPLTALDWSDLPAPSGGNHGTFLEIRLRSQRTNNDPELLKRLGFRWDPEGGYWWAMTPAAGFDIDDFCGQDWLHDKVAVEVRTEDGTTTMTRA